MFISRVNFDKTHKTQELMRLKIVKQQAETANNRRRRKRRCFSSIFWVP